MARTSRTPRILRTLGFGLVLAAVPALSACDNSDDGSADSDDDGSADDGTDTDAGTGDDVNQGTACERNPQGDVYAVGLTKEGEHLKVTFVDAKPAPPRKGDNEWTMMITDLADQPMTDLQIVVTPTMPAHGHGTTVVVEVVAGEQDGEYVFNPVNLFMAGLWNVAIDIDMAEGVTDTVEFEFCIDP